MWDWLPQWHTPQAFFLAPLAVAGVWWSARARNRPTAIFSSLQGLKEVPVTIAQRVKAWMPVIRCLGLLFLTVALARPQLGITETRVRTEGIAIEAALDVSGSMEAMDFSLDDKQVTRLEAVKHVLGEFVTGSKGSGLRGRANDLLGLVGFGGTAYSRCPLTLDHGAFVDVLNSLEVPRLVFDRQGRPINRELVQEERATAIGDALALALDRLEQVEAKSKVIVLLSDGESNVGVVEPEKAIEAAKQKGVKIYAIGIGHTGQAPIQVEDAYGRTVIEHISVSLDEDLLREAADKTGGSYYHAENTEALVEVYKSIDQLERSETEQAVYTEYDELFLLPLLAGLGLLLLEAVLMATRFRALP